MSNLNVKIATIFTYSSLFLITNNTKLAFLGTTFFFVLFVLYRLVIYKWKMLLRSNMQLNCILTLNEWTVIEIFLNDKIQKWYGYQKYFPSGNKYITSASSIKCIFMTISG